MPDFALFFRIIGVKIGSFLVSETPSIPPPNTPCKGIFVSFFEVDDWCKFFREDREIMAF